MNNKHCLMPAALIWLAIAVQASEALAICEGPGLKDFSDGVYEVVQVRESKFPCIDSKTDMDSIQAGPGCFINVKRMDKSKSDLSSDLDLKFFANGNECKLKVGAKISRKFTSYCCPDNLRPVHFCGEIPSSIKPSEIRFCFQEKVFRESPDFDIRVKKLRSLETRWGNEK